MDIDMKRLVWTLILACCALTLEAQGGIKVNYTGANPTISDFAWAIMTANDGDEEADMDEAMNALRQAWIRNRDGIPQEEGVTLTVDQKNGFVLYESRQDEHLTRIELCYWNEADKKHKLIAYNVACFMDGKYSAGQYDGLRFYRYNQATKTMEGWYEDTGFEVAYMNDDGTWVSYALPRIGKDIVVTTWFPDGPKQKTLKWDGRRFGF